MSETYDATYAAVRSRMGHISDEAVSEPVRQAFSGVSHLVQMLYHDYVNVINDYATPSAIFKPRMTREGNMWCAIYGENFMDGVCGFGETPAKAMQEFDKNWNNQKIGTVK